MSSPKLFKRLAGKLPVFTSVLLDGDVRRRKANVLIARITESER